MNRNIAKQFTTTLSLLDVASDRTHKYKCFHGEDIQLTVNVVGENNRRIDLSNTSVKIYFTLDKNVNEPIYRQDTGIVVDNLGIITVMLEKSYIRIGNNTLKIVLYDEDQTVFLQPLIISCIDPLIGEEPDLEIPDDINVRDEIYDIRRIIGDLQDFDDDLGSEITEARNEYGTVGERLDDFDSQFDTIAQTNKTLSINLVDYKKYATIVNDKLDWSTAFNKIIEEIKSYENKSLTIKLPSDNLFINSPIVFDDIPSVSLIGDNIYNCRITPSSNLTGNDFIFTFKPKNVNGAAICGLSISNIWFDMGNSECGGIKCSSLNDNVNFTNLHFRNITGNAFKLVTRDSTTPLAYNFIEGVNFDKVTIIGIEKRIRMTNKSLIEITSETGDIGGANEIYFYRCKFYCNPTTHDKTLLNSRKAIKGDVYTKGWAITECAFVSNVDNDFIQIGSDTQVSEGHRIYSNMFENFHENGEGWAACINLKNSDKYISNAHNFIGYNRFEYTDGLKYKYRIFTNNTTVFEPFLKVSEVSIPQGSYGNNIMVFGDTNLANYRNQIFSGNGQGYEISSKLSVMSRNDSDSYEIKNINPKITLDDLVDGVVKNRLEIKSSNYYYDSVENGYVDFNQNGVNAFYIYKGCYHVGKKDNPPENINGGCIYFNNQTKKFMGFNGTSWIELG